MFPPPPPPTPLSRNPAASSTSSMASVGLVMRGPDSFMTSAEQLGFSISGMKFIQEHAKRVLERLGIEEECFELIICFETLNPHIFLGKKASSQVIL